MSALAATTPLPIARYRFSARVVDALALPPYAGSLLRGQFGAALRHLACMTRQPSCIGCPLRDTCPYPRIFEANRPMLSHPDKIYPCQKLRIPAL